MFSRDKAPVGGICIKEIFEVNVVPFTFGMYNEMVCSSMIAILSLTFVRVFIFSYDLSVF